MNAFDFLISLGDNILLNNDKYYKEGINGPWNQKETLARVYSHFSTLFSRLYVFTNNKKYLNESEKLLEIIIDDFAPMDAAVWHRIGPDCDLSNGLMGQAWTLEAFYTHYRATNNNKYLSFCESLINKHKFDSKQGLWNILNVDGSHTSVDFTFNHQLWFYTMVKLFSKIIKIDEKSISDFETNLNNSNIFHISKSGPIRHPSFGQGLLIPLYRRFKYLKASISGKTYKLKEAGYHLFNLIAFSKLEKEKLIPERTRLKLLKNINTYLKSNKFDQLIYESPYSFYYNPPGFELSTVLNEFNVSDNNLNSLKEKLIRKQFSYFDFKSMIYSVEDSSFDNATNTSRIYELAMISSENLKNLKIQ